jgi:hypothetical protein
MLGRFEIEPTTTRIADRTPRGYQLADFQDAFSRYLPPASPLSKCNNATTRINTGENDDFQSATATPMLRVEKCEMPNKTEACGVVALSTAPAGVEEEL